MPLSDTDKKAISDELVMALVNTAHFAEYVDIGTIVLLVLAGLQLTVLVALIFLGWWPLIAAVPVIAWAMLRATRAVRRDAKHRDLCAAEGVWLAKALVLG